MAVVAIAGGAAFGMPGIASAVTVTELSPVQTVLFFQHGVSFGSGPIEATATVGPDDGTVTVDTRSAITGTGDTGSSAVSGLAVPMTVTWKNIDNGRSGSAGANTNVPIVLATGAGRVDLTITTDTPNLPGGGRVVVE